jgi:Tol biopolymer transport system component
VADGAPEGSFPSDLHLIAPDGTGEHTVYSAPDSDYVRWPTWRRDGRYIAFVEQPGGGSSRYTTTGDAIMLLNLASQVATVLLQLPPNTIVRDLDWARNRDAIAYATRPYACGRPRGKTCTEYGLYVLELDAQLAPADPPLLVVSGNFSGPTWAPDDASLLYSDGSTIHQYTFATGRITNLASGGQPDWRR